MGDGPVIVWFRQDLRLTDNPALSAAAASERPVIPLYIRDDAAAGRWAPGGASRWWLHGSLAALARELAGRGAPLMLRSGAAEKVLAELVAESGATAVAWNRCYEPWAIRRDTRIKSALQARGVEVASHNAALLFEPWTIRTRMGLPYGVFTPFWRNCLQQTEPPRPLPAPKTLSGYVNDLASEDLDSWSLRPARPDWAGGLRAAWTPGEDGAEARLASFLGRAIRKYKYDRNRPHRNGTSQLSPHLHWGEIGPRQIWHRVRALRAPSAAVDTYLAELGWREFSHHLLYHQPDLPKQPLQPEFRHFPWRRDKAALAAWRRGRTGYPIVDAGMRELWQTGWMHNRVRMIVASFLVKDLLLPWQDGEAWFWDTLVDADLASNAASWQWVAGCGADAAPFFRIFNPVLQGERFDPDGDYVRRFVPELAKLPAEIIHKPWEAAADVLCRADVVLGTTYPKPIVDHEKARARALAAFAEMKGR
jgi:deoxyribodipyrimidine photo-lyase